MATAKTGTFSDAEREAIKARAKELAAEAKAEKNRALGEQSVLAAIAEMPEADQVMARKIHALVSKNAPQLWPRTWYGMPAYTKEGKVVCFFQSADKFKARYATFGFDGAALLDDGHMWATSFALLKIGPAEEEKIAELIKKAVS